MGCFACFDGGNKQQRKEQEKLASTKARVKAADAAKKWQEQFENFAAWTAARAQMQEMAKQLANTNKGVLKWQMT